MRTALRALRATLLLAAVTGIAYPLVMTGIGQVAFAHDADGSLVDVAGQPVGSALIGQRWTGPQWFYGRPSAVQNDAATEAKVSAALNEVMRGRTAFVIAHRLATVGNATRILVFDRGRIVEQGSHAALATRAGGIYRGLFERQVLEFERTAAAG